VCVALVSFISILGLGANIALVCSAPRRKRVDSLFSSSDLSDGFIDEAFEGYYYCKEE